MECVRALLAQSPDVAKLQILNDNWIELNQYLNLWLRRYRLQRSLKWAGRGLVAGLAISLVAALIALPAGLLVQDEFLGLVLALSLGSLLAFGLAAYFWPLSRLRAARFFDRRFGLFERTSTALELMECDVSRRRGSWPRKPRGLETARITVRMDTAIPRRLETSHSNTEDLAQKQLADALAAARRVDLRAMLPLRFPRSEALAAVLLVAGLGLLWSRGTPFFNSAQQARLVKQAITAEAVQVEKLRDQINQVQSLNPEQKKQLSAPLNEALRQLQQARSLEQALSILESAQDQLHALDSPRLDEQASQLQKTGESLAQAPGSPLQGFGQQLKEGDEQAAARALQDLDPSALSQSQKKALSQQLDQAAQSLAETNPQLSEQLQAAADALSQGDSPQSAQSARQSLQDAAQNLAETGQQIDQSQLAGQTASQLGQGQQRLVQAGESAQALAQGTPGNSPGAGGQPGQGQGQGSASNQNGDGANTGSNPGSESGGGAGRGEGGGESSPGGEAGIDPITQDNAPGDGGERAYDQVYVPQHLGGTGGPDVSLPGSGVPGDQSLGQGGNAPGANSPSSVPYVDVFSAYQEALRQAIQTGQVPAHLRGLVREYFSGLEPGK